uniref:Putative secreted protein n=1 Tax=Anopheles triannulatus TaxID=58253 RepID=A0A2M4B2S9_9DIPT
MMMMMMNAVLQRQLLVTHAVAEQPTTNQPDPTVMAAVLHPVSLSEYVTMSPTHSTESRLPCRRRRFEQPSPLGAKIRTLPPMMPRRWAYARSSGWWQRRRMRQAARQMATRAGSEREIRAPIHTHRGTAIRRRCRRGCRHRRRRRCPPLVGVSDSEDFPVPFSGL